MAEDDEVVDVLEEVADAEPADLDEDLVDEEIDEDLVVDETLGEDALVVDDAVVADDEEEDEDDTAAADRPTRTAAAAADDDEDTPDPDDVEADLDTILKDRIAAGDDEDEDEEEEKPGRVIKTTEEDTGDGTNRVAPRKAGEFVCSSCFLVKPNMQLADAKKKLCLDCV